MLLASKFQNSITWCRLLYAKSLLRGWDSQEDALGFRSKYGTEISSMALIRARIPRRSQRAVVCTYEFPRIPATGEKLCATCIFIYAK